MDDNNLYEYISKNINIARYLLNENGSVKLTFIGEDPDGNALPIHGIEEIDQEEADRSTLEIASLAFVAFGVNRYMFMQESLISKTTGMMLGIDDLEDLSARTRQDVARDVLLINAVDRGGDYFTTAFEVERDDSGKAKQLRPLKEDEFPDFNVSDELYALIPEETPSIQERIQALRELQSLGYYGGSETKH